MGFALAQTRVAWLVETTDEEKFALALRASLQGERDGFYFLGWCYEQGLGCDRDELKAKENYLLAASLNHVQAMVECGLLFDKSDPQRWHWLGLAAARGNPVRFLSSFDSIVNRVSSDPSLAPAVFMIGRALKGHINAKRRTIFEESSNYASHIGPAKRAFAFFSFQCAAARAAVNMWVLIARRELSNHVNRDIRKKIGMLIWEARELGNYKESAADEVAFGIKERSS